MDAHTTESLHPALEGLSPRNLWMQFDGLRKQPRPSTKEHQAVKWVCEWAQTNGFEVTKDEIGNICVKVPASAGATSTETVCLQGHIDMVCAKDPNSTHNFETDPIELKREGNLLKANRTTLGADNGIGIAAMMAAATDPSVEHPAMELLLTIDEEDGLIGVDNLDPKALDMKSTSVVNLDTEHVGELVVKSAGFHGLEGQAYIHRLEEMPVGGHYVRFDLSGFKGGHSGLDIEKGRGNPILSMRNLLADLLPKGAKLVSFDGGVKDNVIPISAQAVVYFPEDAKPENFEPLVTKFYDDLTKAFGEVDLNLLDEVIPDGREVFLMTDATHERILDVLRCMPNGVLEMHDKLSGVVGVSSNVGKVFTGMSQFSVNLSVRAFNDEKLASAVDDAKYVFHRNLFDVKDGAKIGGWDGDPDSALADMAKEAYAEVTGVSPVVTGANCGLEVADVLKKLKAHHGFSDDVKFDGVSFGPTLNSVHSPDENVEIDTVDVFYEQLVALLGKLAKA